MNEMSTPTIGDNSRIKAYDPFRKQLAELAEKNAVTFDYEDPEGNKEARSHVYALRKVRAELDRVRKAEKAESLAYGRRVDEQAKEIEAEIEKLIAVHQAKIDEIEQREKERVKKHEDAIAEIEGGGTRAAQEWLTLPLEAMRDRLREIENTDGVGDTEEFAPLYQRAIETATLQLRDAIARRETHDAEQAELARLRQESEARERADREESLRREGEARAAEAEQRRAQEEKDRAERAAQAERDAAAKREQDLKDAAEKAERDRVAAEERAANAAKETEERLRREAEEKANRDAAEQQEREANKRHRAAVNNAAKAAFIKGGLSDADAETAVTLIAAKKVPNVEIRY